VSVTFVGSGFITETALECTGYRVEVTGLHAANLIAGKPGTASEKLTAEVIPALQLEVGKEEELVFDDRPPDAHR